MMSKGKILITTRSFRKIAGRHQTILEDAGYELVNSPYDRPMEGHELAALMTDIDAAIVGVDHVTAEVFATANKLKVLSRYGIGFDRVDLEAATQHGVIVTNTPGANSVAVAELTFGLMLSLARHIPRQDRGIRREDWTPLPGVELSGQTLGLVGLGRIGQEVARRATAFDMRVLFYDPYPPAPEVVARLNLRSCDLETLLAEGDFISLHLPLLDSTQNLISAQALNKMKPSAYLINTARGGIVDEQALFEALNTGRLAGAAFDAFAHEPSLANPLLQLENFVSTPHAGSSTRQTTLRMGLMASENALAVLNGNRPECVVNPAVLSYLGEK